MPQVSAGLVMYRRVADKIQVLLAHPGGPFYRNKDAGAWTIPKGEVEADEDLLDTACREFREEIGMVPAGPFVSLKPVKQKAGKIVHAWACAGDCDPSVRTSNTFTIEWPPKSGKRVSFPEVDRAEFFSIEEAKLKINSGQIPLLEELCQILNSDAAPGDE